MSRFLNLLALLSGLLALLPPGASAADPMTDAIQAAYAPYRLALFKTNSKSQAESVAALKQTRTAWGVVTGRFGDRAPAPYDADSKVKTDFLAVDAAFARAADEIEQGRLAEAHETLERVRNILAELRRRNGVIVFSDHMNLYHREMEHVLSDGTKLLAQPGGAMRLMAGVGVLGYLAQRLGEEATPSLSRNGEFVEQLQAVVKSVGSLETAVLSGDITEIRKALAALKMPYGRLFLKFG